MRCTVESLCRTAGFFFIVCAPPPRRARAARHRKITSKRQLQYIKTRAV